MDSPTISRDERRQNWIHRRLSSRLHRSSMSTLSQETLESRESDRTRVRGSPTIMESTDPAPREKIVQFLPAEVTRDVERSYTREPGESGATPWSGKTLLSLDGGGIRGVSSLAMLSALMKVIEDEEVAVQKDSESSFDSPLLDASVPSEEKSSEYLPCHYFDFICGTSTGGLIAIMLGRMRLSVETCIEKFDSISSLLEPSISSTGVSHFLSFNFTRSWPTPRSDKVFDELFSEHVTSKKRIRKDFESNPTLCKTIVLAVQIMRGTKETHLFRSYETDNLTKNLSISTRSSSYHGDIAKLSVAQVAKACTAPPTFKPYKIERTRYKDGSSWNLNPARIVFDEATSFRAKGEVSVDITVSIGTPAQYSRSDWQKLPEHRFLTESHDRSQKQMDHLAEVYWRFNVDADVDQKPDGRKVLERLRKATSDILEHSDDKTRLVEVAKKLVRIRRARAATAAWESFALKNVGYECKKPDCPTPTKRFTNRTTLLQHWIIKHEFDRPDVSTQAEVEAELNASRIYK